MRIAVTGAAGLVGGAVVRASLLRGHEVRVAVRGDCAIPDVEVMRGDVLDAEAMRRACTGVDAVIHCAALLRAPWRADFQSVNEAGAATVARACAEQARPPALVLVSSLAAMGPAPRGGSLREADEPRPVSIYGRAKLAAERAALAAAGGAPVTIVRPPAVFGGNDRALLPLFRMALRGIALVPARASASFVHEDDLAALVVAAAERGERVRAGASNGEGVYLACASDATQPALAAHIAGALGAACRVAVVPAPLLVAAAALSEGLARLRGTTARLSLDKARELRAGDWVGSGEKARRGLGWSPLPLEARLRETAQAYRARGWLPAGATALAAS
jgi:dihydroflavonol-4-reductase